MSKATGNGCFHHLCDVSVQTTHPWRRSKLDSLSVGKSFCPTIALSNDDLPSLTRPPMANVRARYRRHETTNHSTNFSLTTSASACAGLLKSWKLVSHSSRALWRRETKFRCDVSTRSI